MILRALYDLAGREGLDPTYEPAEVRFLIRLGEEGRYLGLTQPLQDAPLDAKGKAKGKPRPSRRPVPRRSERTSGVAAEFLVDKAQYVFGIDPGRKTKPDRLQECRTAFLERIEKALADSRLSGNRGLRAVQAFLSGDPPAEVRKALSPETPSEQQELTGALCAFVYDPEASSGCVHDHPDVRAYWLEALMEGGAGIGECLVTGRGDAPLSRLHAAPKGIPPISTTKRGVPLTSVNAAAFRSYGLEDIGCAPISLGASLKIEAALTRLLDPAFPGPGGTPLPSRVVRLRDDTALVYWSREDAGLDFLQQLAQEDPDRVRDAIHAPYKGRPPALQDATAFYALVLSGMQGRGIVRSMVESTVAGVATNVRAYLDEAALQRPYDRGVGAYPLFECMKALVARGDLDALPPGLAIATYLAILFGRPFPRALLDLALRRARIDLVPEAKYGGNNALAARCCLLKAYLSRNERKEVTVSLDSQRTDPAYRLGRLLAALDRLQADALGGGVNATIVDRYYGSASSTPSAVFPTLVRRSQHHLGKVRREKPGLAVVRDRLVQEIVSGLAGFPQTLNLVDQGLFALGYYHQRQDFFTSKGEKEA